MKSYILITILCIIMLLTGIYGRINRAKLEYMNDGIISLSSPNHQLNVQIILFYRNMWLDFPAKMDFYIIKDQKQVAKATILEADDINLHFPVLKWKDNHTLDIILDHEDSQGIEGKVNYFFKELNNLSITVYYLKQQH